MNIAEADDIANAVHPAPAEDSELLRDYAETGSEEAFNELIERHRDWVYATALRQLRDSAAAQDVAQTVFIVLARKAGSLRRETVLSGWLFRAIRYAAIDFMRSEIRRQKREQAAAAASEPAELSESSWEDVAPHVDECVAQLRPSDQRAILLRYYEQKSWGEIGARLGIKENAARVRVDRALLKLRARLEHRGIAPSLAALASALLAANAEAAPLSIIKPTNPLPDLSQSVLRRFLQRQIEIASVVTIVLAACFLTVASFRRPLSQDLFVAGLIGRDAFEALDSLDHSFLDGNAAQFLSRIHFRNESDRSFSSALGEFVTAYGTFRKAGMARYGQYDFAYYASLDVLFAQRERPTIWERHGDYATGKFARRHGLHLIRIDGVWKWDFFGTFTDEDRKKVIEKTIRMQELTADLHDSGLDLDREAVVALFRSR